MALIKLGYRVIPQVGSVGVSIDMVEREGGRRLAVECDGDRVSRPGALGGRQAPAGQFLLLLGSSEAVISMAGW
jgi:hypothetical protein